MITLTEVPRRKQTFPSVQMLQEKVIKENHTILFTEKVIIVLKI